MVESTICHANNPRNSGTTYARYPFRRSIVTQKEESPTREIVCFIASITITLLRIKTKRLKHSCLFVVRKFTSITLEITQTSSVIVLFETKYHLELESCMLIYAQKFVPSPEVISSVAI